MELEVTWKRALQIWWAYLWRKLVVLLIGAILGGIIGFALAPMAGSTIVIQVVSIPIGLIIGFAISIVPLKMILGKDFGDFRLALLEKQRLQIENSGGSNASPLTQHSNMTQLNEAPRK